MQNLPLVLLPAEVEELLRMSRWTLKRQREEGQPPGALVIRISPRIYRYSTAAIQDYLETQGISREESARRILELQTDDQTERKGEISTVD